MCGIAGIIGRVDDANRTALARMAYAMRRRGPDGEGIWTSPPDQAGHGCLLAHRRLSILDLSHSADQPMTDPVTGQTIVFNGEIYNYPALRAQLVAQGNRFESTGDTAVMLRALGVRGTDALGTLRGMFAFGLWDPQRSSLTLGRDPLGIKPLYYCRNPDDSPDRSWSILFASQVRAILATGLVRPVLDPAAVASVVWNGFVTGPGSAVLGVRELWPGTCTVFDARGAVTDERTFWRLPAPAGNRATEQDVHEALSESVRAHLVSDVPLGVFLSGGVDSSAVANLAQRVSGERINTFTLAFDEADYNEGEIAGAVAKQIGTNHHQIKLTEARFIDDLDDAIDSLDQPSFDGLNSYYIARAVREAGLTVALIGTGGDELFGGYRSFRELPKFHELNRRTRWIPLAAKMRAARLIGRMAYGPASGIGAQTRWAKLPEMLRAGDDLLGLYQLAYALFLPEFGRDLLAGSAGAANLRSGLPTAFHQRLLSETAGRSPLSAISAMELRCFLGQRLLRDTDAASMAVSLEVRLPLVDSVLVEALAGVDDKLRYQPLGRKALLRRVGLRGLDPALFERPKSGFVLPFDRWIRSSLGETMDRTMRDPDAARSVYLNPDAVRRLWSTFQSGGKGMYWSRVWALYILMRWSRKYAVTC